MLALCDTLFSKSLVLDMNAHFVLGYIPFFLVTGLHPSSEFLPALMIILKNNRLFDMVKNTSAHS